MPTKPPVATSLQKYRVLLESLHAAPRQAVVYCDSTPLGILDEVTIRWRVHSTGISLLVESPERRLQGKAASIRAIAGGLELLIRERASYPPHRVSVIGAEQPVPTGGAHALWNTVRSWLELRYPGSRLVRVSTAIDRAHSISGTFLRAMVQWRGRELFVLCADPFAPLPEPHAVLTQALLWMRLVRQRRASGGAARLFLVVPAALAAVVCHCARRVDPARVRIAVWELCESGDGMEVRRAPRPKPPVENRDFRWPVLGPFHWTPLLGRVLDLAPEFIRRYPRFQDYDSLRLSGLEFARAVGHDRDRIVFGMGGQQIELTEDNFEDLRALVGEILYFRRADGPDSTHPYYRMQAERWLESLILDSAATLFPELAPEAVYSQIPVYLGADPGRVDILGVDRNGTLVVMELKVVAIPGLPVQALDYWGRVVQHNNRGDFQLRGYFAETRLNRRRPKIYLVSPVFSFHDSTESITGFLDPALDVWKISVNEDWRCGVRVLRRTRVRRHT
jgi:hypothetical protein